MTLQEMWKSYDFPEKEFSYQLTLADHEYFTPTKQFVWGGKTFEAGLPCATFKDKEYFWIVQREENGNILISRF